MALSTRRFLESNRMPPSNNRSAAHNVVSTDEIRSAFPALEREHEGLPVAYFDGPGGTQVPRVVAEAMTDYLFHHNANTGWAFPTSIESDAELARARQVLRRLPGHPPMRSSSART